MDGQETPNVAAGSSQEASLASAAGNGGPPTRRGAGWLLTTAAALLVLAAVLAPSQFGHLTPGAFVRIPLEGLLAVAVLLALPARARQPVAALLGVLLSLLTIVKIADLGFSAALGRPFNVLIDWVLLDDAVDFVHASFGRPAAVGAVAAATLLLLALPIALVGAVLRLSRRVARYHAASTRAVAVLTAIWVACAVFDVRIVPGLPVADTHTTTLAATHLRQLPEGIRDRDRFAAEIVEDAFRHTPGDQLLTALRGKDVLFVFIESYGRNAVEAPEFAPAIGALLDAGYRRLHAAGYDARSAFLTSSTIGGASWLAHDTLFSGLWIDTEQRHRALLASDRFTLHKAFRRANWEVVGVMPAVTHPWPEGAFFGYQRFYDNHALGYRGPNFAYAPIPDQYTLAAFHRLEHGRRDRGPLMAEIALVSSHSPWTVLPRMLDWSEVGDGSVYHHSRGVTHRDAREETPSQARDGYRRTIEYTLSCLISYIETYGNDDLVVVFLGDHQPSPLITGDNPSRDVPITIVARDPAVFDQIAEWGWQPGLRPGPQAPVWRMDSFRDRFLTAFSS